MIDNIHPPPNKMGVFYLYDIFIKYEKDYKINRK